MQQLAQDLNRAANLEGEQIFPSGPTTENNLRPFSGPNLQMGNDGTRHSRTQRSRETHSGSLKRGNSTDGQGQGQHSQDLGIIVSGDDMNLGTHTSGAALANYANKKRILEGSSAQPPHHQ